MNMKTEFQQILQISDLFAKANIKAHGSINILVSHYLLSMQHLPLCLIIIKNL